MQILCRIYSIIPGGYKPKNLRALKCKSTFNVGYFLVLMEYLHIQIPKQPNETQIESVNYYVYNPYMYIYCLCINPLTPKNHYSGFVIKLL